MAQILICAHPWEMIQNTQVVFGTEPPEHIPAIYRCPICKKLKNEGEINPRVILGTIETV